MDNQISPKKKKSTFSPGTSPNNTSQLIKRSKIEDEEDEEVPLEDKEIRQEIPLSPSINFIDASMTESFESTKIKGKNKSNFFQCGEAHFGKIQNRPLHVSLSMVLKSQLFSILHF